MLGTTKHNTRRELILQGSLCDTFEKLLNTCYSGNYSEVERMLSKITPAELRFCIYFYRFNSEYFIMYKH